MPKKHSNKFYVKDKNYPLTQRERDELQNIGQHNQGQVFNPDYLTYLANKYIVLPENQDKIPTIIPVDMSKRTNSLINKPSFIFDAPKLNSEITTIIPRRKTGKSPNVPSGFFEQSKLDNKQNFAASNIQRLYKGFRYGILERI